MATHTINLTLTTEQVIHLNNALNEHLQANIDAISSEYFQSETSDLFKQCDALQTFIDTISNLVNGVQDA